MLALYTQYFPESCEKYHKHITRVGYKPTNRMDFITRRFQTLYMDQLDWPEAARPSQIFQWKCRCKIKMDLPFSRWNFQASDCDRTFFKQNWFVQIWIIIDEILFFIDSYVRAEILAGFINALFLLFIAFFIFSEAVEVRSFYLY